MSSFKTNYNFGDIERKLGYKFKNPDLLAQALTHASANQSRLKNYERLEFVGDRIVNLYVSKMLVDHDKTAREGDLARRMNVLVKVTTLAQIARDIGLPRYIVMSHSEEATGGRNKEAILCDVVEAIIGAVGLDSSFARAGMVVKKLWKTWIPKSASKEMDDDYKTRVQEIVQRRRSMPVYQVVGRTGPDHSPKFVVQLSARGFQSARGVGTSKKAAEQDAAHNFLKRVTQ